LPAFKSSSVFEIARGIKAFLRLDFGLVRGEVPDMDRETGSHPAGPRQARELERARALLAERDRQLERLKKRLSAIDRRTEDAGGDLTYEELYEARIKSTSPDAAIGTGSSLTFDTVGRLELEFLTREGLRSTDTLVDLGCGTGRLAVHAVAVLTGGHYVGIDISRTMLDEARKRVEQAIPDPPCRVSWMHQTSQVFELDDGSVDMICAFSVINHMEHEDAYLYLKEALRIVRPGGRFVFSCLPVGTDRAREVFLKSAGMDMRTRHRRVRHVVTSRELMTNIAQMAGWTVVRWHDGDEEIQLTDTGERHRFNQSVCVLEAHIENEVT
jgi:ubiquinone/menaquinone biosynthesis C-methylase UbiE